MQILNLHKSIQHTLSLEKKIEDVDKNVPNVNSVVTTTALTVLKLQNPTLIYM